MHAAIAALASAIALLCSPVALARQSSGPNKPLATFGPATTMMSPVVVATWIAERREGGPEELQLLVLWRGTVGWFFKGGGLVSGGGSAGRYHTTITYSGVRLTLDFDPSKRVATVQGTTVELGADNVVFVDDVDSPKGPRVTGTERVERAMPGSAGQIGLVLRTSPEIMSFLRCDSTPPGARGRAFLEKLCLQNIGVSK